MPEGKNVISPNDFIRVKVKGENAPLNGRRLIVLGWGPDMKMVARVLAQESIECEMILIAYNRVPNALVTYLDEIATKGIQTEIICVAPNPNNGLLGPVMHRLKTRLDFPEDLIFSGCTINSAFVP